MTRRNWLAMAATGAFAAAPKNRVPISRDALVVRMPDAEPVRLANGVTILAIEDRRLPIATLAFKIEGAGEIFATTPGVASLTAAMLSEGAAGRSGKQTVEAASRAGASLINYADPGAEMAVVDGEGLAAKWPEWFELMCGMVQKPAFPADEFQQMRQRWEAELRMQRPAARADQRLLQMVYGKHPAAIGYPVGDALASLTPEMLAAWHRERYTPSNAVITCIGKVRVAELRTKAENLLGAWRGPNVGAFAAARARGSGLTAYCADRPAGSGADGDRDRRAVIRAAEPRLLSTALAQRRARERDELAIYSNSAPGEAVCVRCCELVHGGTLCRYLARAGDCAGGCDRGFTGDHARPDAANVR